MMGNGSFLGVSYVNASCLLALGAATLCLSGCEAPRPSRIAFARDAPLSHFLRLLSVGRIDQSGQFAVSTRFDDARQSPRQMHEPGAASLLDRLFDFQVEGGLDGRWVLGEPTWDALGFTLQRSGGEARPGLWAHPRDGTVLRIEGRFDSSVSSLQGFHGFSDFSIEQATHLGIEDPVQFELRVDGTLVYRAEVARKAGWETFEANLPEPIGAGEHELEIRISSTRDKWSHFVFDLWSDAERY
jgi:hypothetical protein